MHLRKVFFHTQMDFKQTQKKKQIDKETDEEIGTTGMPELESEELDFTSYIEGKGLKTLTPN